MLHCFSFGKFFSILITDRRWRRGFSKVTVRCLRYFFMEDASKNEEKASSVGSFLNRWFFLIFFLVAATSVAATFYRIFIARDYFVLMETVCDPSASACFARDICETEDGMCAEGDVPVETEYYKIVERKAFSFPEVCATGSLENELCADVSCRPGEDECSETFCSEEIVPGGETCFGPDAGVETDDAGGVTAEEREVTEAGSGG